MTLHKKCNQNREKSFYCIFMRATKRMRCTKKEANKRMVQWHLSTELYTRNCLKCAGFKGLL